MGPFRRPRGRRGESCAAWPHPNRRSPCLPPAPKPFFSRARQSDCPTLAHLRPPARRSSHARRPTCPAFPLAVSACSARSPAAVRNGGGIREVELGARRPPLCAPVFPVLKPLPSCAPQPARATLAHPAMAVSGANGVPQSLDSRRNRALLQEMLRHKELSGHRLRVHAGKCSNETFNPFTLACAGDQKGRPVAVTQENCAVLRATRTPAQRASAVPSLRVFSSTAATKAHNAAWTAGLNWFHLRARIRGIIRFLFRI